MTQIDQQGADVTEADGVDVTDTTPAVDAVDDTTVPKVKKKKKKKKAIPPPPPPRRRFTWLWAVALAVIVALIAISVILWTRVVHNNHINSARRSALSTAQTYARDFGTYDYRNLDQDFALITSELTGSFKATYSSTAQSLKATVVKYQERSTATVQGAGVTSISPHHAVVIVLLDQSVTSINSTTPVVNRNRAVITLVRSGSGKWLMSGLDLK